MSGSEYLVTRAMLPDALADTAELSVYLETAVKANATAELELFPMATLGTAGYSRFVSASP